MKKEGGLTIKINFTNRWLYTLIAVGIIAIIGVGVYAATYSPSGAGHPYTEISTCGPNQILKMNSNGTNWSCANSVGTTPVYLLNNCCVHGSTGLQSSMTTSPTCPKVSDYIAYCPVEPCLDPCPFVCRDGITCSNSPLGYV
jgi:hypothetical protein